MCGARRAAGRCGTGRDMSCEVLDRTSQRLACRSIGGLLFALQFCTDDLDQITFRVGGSLGRTVERIVRVPIHGGGLYDTEPHRAAQLRCTLAPWVQRVGVVASRRAASRLRGRPRDQGVTSPRTLPGPGVPTRPIPAHTDSQPIPVHTQGLPAMGAQRKALARRADALPGHPPHCHVGGRHRVAGRPATGRRRLGAGRSMAGRHR
jgi:hypothetical protein